MALLDTVEVFSNFSLGGVGAGLALASLLVSRTASRSQNVPALPLKNANTQVTRP